MQPTFHFSILISKCPHFEYFFGEVGLYHHYTENHWNGFGLVCNSSLMSIFYICGCNYSPCPRLQLQSPGHYSPLEAFYEDKRALLPPSGDGVVTACPANAWGAAINHSMHPEMKVGEIFAFNLWSEVFLTLYYSLTCVCVCVNTCAPDHPPCRLYVTVHPFLWGADHGAVETSSPSQTHPHLLPSTCGGGVLQGWEFIDRN